MAGEKPEDSLPSVISLYRDATIYLCGPGEGPDAPPHLNGYQAERLNALHRSSVDGRIDLKYADVTYTCMTDIAQNESGQAVTRWTIYLQGMFIALIAFESATGIIRGITGAWENDRTGMMRFLDTFTINDGRIQDREWKKKFDELSSGLRGWWRQCISDCDESERMRLSSNHIVENGIPIDEHLMPPSVRQRAWKTFDDRGCRVQRIEEVRQIKRNDSAFFRVRGMSCPEDTEELTVQYYHSVEIEFKDGVVQNEQCATDCKVENGVLPLATKLAGAIRRLFGRCLGE